jgi:hypothetical protein
MWHSTETSVKNKLYVLCITTRDKFKWDIPVPPYWASYLALREKPLLSAALFDPNFTSEPGANLSRVSMRLSFLWLSEKTCTALNIISHVVCRSTDIWWRQKKRERFHIIHLSLLWIFHTACSRAFKPSYKANLSWSMFFRHNKNNP